MRISVPCNWQRSLLRAIEENPAVKKNVHDFYGTFDESFTGSGRPFFLFPKMDREKVQNFINTVHDMGLKFTWLWNGECLGYFKFNRKEQTRAINELDWLDDMKVEYLTVADPYLAEFARTYSSIPIKVSVISEVNTVGRALDWQELIGTQGIISVSYLANRNFPLLEAIKKSVNCDLELLANDCCLQDCPFRFFHYTECSHASQNYDPLNCYYNDWSSIACMNQKCFHYEQLLMCRWIQPDDIEKYLHLGYDYFKISGRRYGTEWIFRALKAYSEQKYEGNLGVIFNAYSFVSDPLELASPQFSELAARNEPMGSADVQGTMLSIPDFQGELVSDELKNFIEKFPNKGATCAENCGVKCFYCFKYADQAFQNPSAKNEQDYREFLLYIHQYLNYGDGFVPEEERVLNNPMKTPLSDSFTGLPWDPSAQDLFDKVMIIVPEKFRTAAREGIGFTAERTAERTGAEKVEKDLVTSVILKVVPTPFRHDAYDFLLEQDINPSNFLTADQIDEIKTLPYGTQEMADKARERGDLTTESQLPQSEEALPSTSLSLNTKDEWEAYLTSFMKAFNGLPELKTQLKSISPLFFQYKITDKPEMSYWQMFMENEVQWGMGSRAEPDIPTVIHKTDFETIKKVNSGESNPVQATMKGTYVIEGDTAKLMACTPILPLNAKAHEISITGSSESVDIKWDDGLVELIQRFKNEVAEKVGNDFINNVTQTAEALAIEDKKTLITSAYLVEAVLSEAGKEKKYCSKRLKKLGFDVNAGKNQAKNRAKGIVWPDEVEDFFLRVISHSGRMVRGIAKRAVSNGATKYALKRHSKEISRMDVIRSNLSETPGPFRKAMFNGLRSEGVTEEEIKDAERLNSESPP